MAQDDKRFNKAGDKRGIFQREKKATKENLRNIGKDLKDQLDTYDKMDDIVNNIFKVKKLTAATSKSILKVNNKTTKQSLNQRKLDAEALELANNIVTQTKERLKGFRQLIVKAKAFNMLAKANPYILLASILAGIVFSAVKIAEATADIRKELGVSSAEAGILLAKFKTLSIVGKAFGLKSEDINSAFDSIRENFGGINAASSSFVLSLAKATLQTGTTAEQLGKVLAIQESLSTLTRDELLNQLKQTSKEIRKQGVTAGAVYRDIAENTQFFAEYARDGGKNILNAAIQARKLGLSLRSVASISESLLNFESSIESQLEASVLLGRQINLDRARQLALAGDTEELLKEVVKQAGGEAEFTKLNVVQRKALADSVGVNVEELSRLVRNQTTGEGSRQVRNAVENFNKTTAENTNKLVLIGLGQKDAINKMKDELAQDR